ncbi:MAG: protein-lysine N-methyltransferase [Desulfurococcaceae archaeon]
MVFVPFVPTPYPVVRAMLKLANAGPEDVVYDLGCGDGRILVVAVKEFNVKKAIGVEIDREKYKLAVSRIREEGIDGRAEVIHGDFFETNISDATVVTLFLLTSVNEMLKPKLEKELKDGARVVSHEFRIPGWRPEKIIEVRDDNGLLHTVILYVKGRHL